jgi:Ni/Fe-hydrogenase subunit HybB-like protein
MNRPDLKDRTRRIKDIFWVLAFAGIVAMLIRFVFGLGATTNLTDRVPWGLWKVLNMIGGAALATSGFTVGFLGHVLKIEKFKRLVKPAILVAFLGYGSSLFALLFDIGLPWRFWHPFVHWNIHSFLFEVFWCVSIYFCITFLEFSPTLLERMGLPKLRGWLHKAGAGFVIVGITLSSMHHTSLGSLFLVTPQRLHALWYSPIISILFILSAMGGGMMVLVVVKVLHSWWYDPDRLFPSAPSSSGVIACKSCTNPEDNGHDRHINEKELLSIQALATLAASILGIYLLLKISHLIQSPDALSGLMAGTWESWLYLTEIVLGLIIPILLVSLPIVRKSPIGLAVSALFAAFGLALNRVNIGIFGYLRDAGEIYFPSAVEWAISIGILAMAGLAFFFLVENFSVFDENWKRKNIQQQKILSSFDRLTHVWHSKLLTSLERVALIGVVVIPLSFFAFYPPFHQPEVDIVSSPLAHDLERNTLCLDGNRDGVSTLFTHAAHQERMGGQTSCTQCHHLSLPGDQATPCADCHKHMEESTLIFDHSKHTEYVAKDMGLTGWHPENKSCSKCHEAGIVKTSATAKGCLECHSEDMNPVYPSEASSLALLNAPGYHTAMHGTCIPCHSEKAEELNIAYLGDCAKCHYWNNEVTPGENPSNSTLLAQKCESASTSPL